MKKLIASLVVIIGIALVVTFTNSNTKEGENSIEEVLSKKSDIKEADVIWTGYKVIGGSHTGTLELKNSSFQFEGDMLTGGIIEIDMSSLQNTDLEGDWNSKLIGHLKSDDFFGIEKYPLSTFKISSVESLQTEGAYKIKGDLTIKETTLEETVVAKVVFDGEMVIVTANFDIDRTKYNVKYGSNNFFEGLGDKAIKDIFNLNVRIVTSVN